jgi:hypothetical protein
MDSHIKNLDFLNKFTCPGSANAAEHFGFAGPVYFPVFSPHAPPSAAKSAT